MSIADTRNSYGSTTKAIHWTVLLLLIVQFALGYTLTSLPEKDPIVKTLTWWHESTGFLIFILAIIFVLWRMRSVTPSLAEIPVWQRLVARSVHGGLYVCLFLQPLLGMSEVMLSGQPVAFYGAFRVPQILPTSKHASEAIGGVHNIVAVVILVLVGLHVLGALHHEFVARDNILRRMLPGAQPSRDAGKSSTTDSAL